jgi:hypothetical protein
MTSKNRQSSIKVTITLGDVLCGRLIVISIT